MDSDSQHGRRAFLQLGTLGGLGLLANIGSLRPAFSQSKLIDIRIVANQATENTVLWQVMKQKGFLELFGVNGTIVNAGSPEKTLDTLTSGNGDICVTAGFTGVLSAISKGAKAKVVGGALRLPNLVVYSNKPDVRSFKDLRGRRIGIGPNGALLHQIMFAALQKNKIDPGHVEFVHVGSNAEVYKAIVAGTIDAGPSDVAYLSSKATHALIDGRMWKELPEYTYQLAFAPDEAIREKREGLVRTLAAYAHLFRFMTRPGSRDDYLGARAIVGASQEEGEAVWSFFQTVHPYATDLVVSPSRIRYRQKLDMAMGMSTNMPAYDQVADMSMARDAIRFLDRR